MLNNIMDLNNSLLSFKSALQDKISRQKNLSSDNIKLRRHISELNEDENEPAANTGLYNKMEEILHQLDYIGLRLDDAMHEKI